MIPAYMARGLRPIEATVELALRAGDYRILCIIEDDKLIVEIFSIGHRSEVYK